MDTTEALTRPPRTRLPYASPPRLHVDIHDSDIATIAYRPSGSGSGVAYLGFTPRVHFEDPDASPPTDVFVETKTALLLAALDLPPIDESAA